MSWLSSLFKPKQAGTTTVNEAPWEAQQPYLQSLFSSAQSLYNQGISPEARTAQRAAYMNALDGGGRLYTDAADEIGRTMRGDYMGANPYLDSMYGSAARRVGEEYQRIVAPTIAGQFARGNRFGSPAYEGMMQRSQDQLGQNLTEMASRMYGGSYEAERGRMLNAAQLAPAIAESSFMPYEKAIMYADPTYLDWSNLSRYQSAVGGAKYGSSKTTPYYTNPLGNALGLGLQGAGLYKALGLGGSGSGAGAGLTAGDYAMTAGAAAGFESAAVAEGIAALGGYAMSDKRLKTNIEKVGSYRGHNLYTFDYVWGEPSIGVMADEVEKVNPGAVSTVNGYKVVNYSAL